MSASNCIGAKAGAGVVSKAKGKAAQKRIKEIREALIAQGETPSVANSLAEQQYLTELTATTARQKWRLVNAVRVRKSLSEAVAKANPKKLGGMAVKMVDDIDFEARAEHKRIMGRVGRFLEKHRINILNKAREPAAFKEFLKALKGEPTSDASAKALADAVNDANEWTRKKLNSYGYSIGKRENWGLPHTHNKITIGTAGFEKWSAFIDPMLDWEKMVNPKTGMAFGERPPDTFRREFLKGAFDSIVYGRDSKNPQWGGSGEGAALERHRTFDFINTDKWIEYNNAYGSADPHSTLLQHFDQMARHIAMARKFGPNAETAIDYLSQLVAQKNRQDGAGVVQAMKAQGGVALARGMIRVIEGGLSPNGWLGAQSARFFSTTRKVLTSALLERAVIISIPSDLNSARLAAQSIGMNPDNFMSTYVNLMKEAAAGGGMTRDDLLRAQHIAESWANPGVTSSRFQQEYPAAAFAELLSNAAMKIQGQTAHTDSAKLAWAWGMAGQMAGDAGKTFGQLNPLMRNAMQAAGIEPADWDLFRNSGGMFTASNGATFLSPLSWLQTTTLAADQADPLFLKMQSFVEKWTELAVPSRSLIAQGVMDPRAYGLAPGSAPYEVIKSAGMFKSFVGAFVVNQSRIFTMKQGAAAKAAYVGDLLLSTTMVGALAIQINEMLMGRDPRPMNDDMFWLNALIKGGGLGPVGDILTTGTSSWGGGIQSYLAGPIPQVVGDGLKLTLGNIAQAYAQAMDGDDIDTNVMVEAMDFIRRYTPMWHSPAALGGAGIDRILGDQFQLLLDPESIDAMADRETKRQNRNGNASFWHPGSIVPDRLPNLGNAIGQ